MRTVAWFRGRDLRVEDQPALAGGAVIPVFILEPGGLDPAAAPFRAPLLRRHLQALRAALRARGSELVVLQGRAEDLLPELAVRWRAGAVRTLRDPDPAWRARDPLLERRLAQAGVEYQLLEGGTLAPPGALRTGAGGPYRVFTPFARAFRREIPVPEPLPAPERLPPVPAEVQGGPWPWEMEAEAEAEAAARQGGANSGSEARLRAFLAQGLGGYHRGRDLLGAEGTSRLSADLAFGALSVRGVWHAVQARLDRDPEAEEGARAFLNELLWREFAHHTLEAWPELATEPFRANWRGFPWRTAPAELEAWKAGRTGYGVVDAAARELLATGHVHNRARMIAATFLTKHLLLDWREGEAHYRRYLADYDPASNIMGWQWCAGCGVDAQPWFRIFNPVTQAQRFDPQGAYVRRWAPGALAPPVVDLAFGRARFLAVAKGFLG